MPVEQTSLKPLPMKTAKSPQQQEMPLPMPHQPQQPQGPNMLIEVIRGFALILAVRLFLFLSLIGAFVLAWYAIHAQTFDSWRVFVTYNVLIIFPLVWLEFKGNSSGG